LIFFDVAMVSKFFLLALIYNASYCLCNFQRNNFLNRYKMSKKKFHFMMKMASLHC
jgi:hypothetical protein